MVFSKPFWTSVWIINLIQPIILLKKPKLWKNCINSSFKLAIIVWFHFLIVGVLKLHINETADCDTSYCRKRLVMLIIWVLCLLIMWYSLVLKKPLVKRMFKLYTAFHDCYRTIFKRSSLIINILTSLHIAVFIVNIIATMVILFSNEELTNTWYDYVKIFEAGPFTKRIILFFYFISSRSIFVLFPGMISLLHLTLFMSLNQVINKCSDYIVHLKTGKHVEEFINTYTKIYKMATSVESAISLEMLFMTSYQYSKMYLIISNLYEETSEIDDILKMDLNIQYLQNCLYTLSLFVAADIHARDSSLKSKIKDVAFRMSFSRGTLVYSDVLTRFVDSKEIITFTAWKMFSFTRTFIITSTGVFLTYSILILQIPGSEK